MPSPSSGSNPPSSFGKTNGRKRMAGFEFNPAIDSMIRKIIPDVGVGNVIGQHTARGEVSVPDPAYLRQVAGTIAQDTTDATSLMQLLPDLELVKNLLVSGILSPKDFVSTELTYAVDRRAFDLPVAGRMLEIIQDYFTNKYDLKRMCPTILEQALFYSGAYPLLVVPENSVDELINGTVAYSNESFQEKARFELFDQKNQLRSLSILGRGPVPTDRSSPATEAFGIESFSMGRHSTGAVDPYAHSLGREYAQTVLITDNYNVAKLAPIMEAKRQSQVKQAIYPNLQASLETNANYAVGGVQRRRIFNQAVMVQAIKTKDMISRPSVGHPLIMHLPPESVIPVFLTPQKHLGYFILLDMEGNPIALANRRDIYNDLSTQNNGTGSSTQGSSQMIQMAQNLSIGVNPQEAKDPAQMARIYGQLLEHELKTRLANGMYGEGARFEAPDEIYQVMMARSLKRQQTQILYVPAELLTYIAFDFAENGTGRSLTEKSKIIGSIRAMLTFSGVMAGIKNSVSRQRVNIELSDVDPDPYKTVSRLMDEYTRRRNVTMPFVASDPADMISYLNMAGVEFNITNAGGKGVPSHKIDVEDKVSNRAKIDTDLHNEMRDRHYMAYGVPPETVLASSGPEFATTALINSQMFAKNVIQRQDQFTPQLEQFVKCVVRNSPEILNDLREIVLLTLKQDAIRKEGRRKDTYKEIVDQPNRPISQPIDVDNPQGLEALPANVGPAPQPATNEVTPEAPQQPLTEEDIQAVERIVWSFISAISISLPRPDTATITNQSTNYDAYSEALDKRLDAIFNTAFLTDAALGAYASRIDEVKAAIKADFQRQWARNNGFLTELEQLITTDEHGNAEYNLKEAVVAHNEQVGKSVYDYLSEMAPIREEINHQTDALNKEFPDTGMTTDGGSQDFGSDQGGFGGEPGGFGSEEGGLNNEPPAGEETGFDLSEPEGGALNEPEESSAEETQSENEEAPSEEDEEGTSPPGQSRKPGEDEEEEES